jgi:hypothetical protein
MDMESIINFAELGKKDGFKIPLKVNRIRSGSNYKAGSNGVVGKFYLAAFWNSNLCVF